MAVVCALALSVVALFISATAEGYELYGGFWSDEDDLKVCVSTSYIPSTGSHSFRWFSAANDWEDDTTFDYSSTCSGEDILLTDFDVDSTSYDGVTIWLPDCCSGSYSYAGAQLNYHYTQNYEGNEVQSVAGHELGHIFGIDHDSGCILLHQSTGIRYGVCGVYTPQSDDIDAFEDIY
jgi:hypothetical protein